MSARATRERRQDHRLPGWWTLTRDILSFAGGWALIFMEAQRPEVREQVMVLAGVIIGIPGLSVGATSLAEAFRRDGTDSSLPESAESPASPS